MAWNSKSYFIEFKLSVRSWTYLLRNNLHIWGRQTCKTSLMHSLLETLSPTHTHPHTTEKVHLLSSTVWGGSMQRNVSLANKSHLMWKGSRNGCECISFCRMEFIFLAYLQLVKIVYVSPMCWTFNLTKWRMAWKHCVFLLNSRKSKHTNSYDVFTPILLVCWQMYQFNGIHMNLIDIKYYGFCCACWCTEQYSKYIERNIIFAWLVTFNKYVGRK